MTSFSSLAVASSQKAGSLTVKATMPETGTITVSGTVSVPKASKVYKLSSVTANATAGQAVTLKVKLAKKTLKAVKKAIKRHKKPKASLTITAKDAKGNTKSEQRSVKLK